MRIYLREESFLLFSGRIGAKRKFAVVWRTSPSWCWDGGVVSFVWQAEKMDYGGSVAYCHCAAAAFSTAVLPCLQAGTNMKIYSVNECSRLMAGRMKKDYIFDHIAVRGTVSSVHTHFSGITYFSLLDGESRLFCVIGRMSSTFLKRRLEGGMEVTVVGDIRYNTFSGWPSLFVERILSVQKSREAEERENLIKELTELGYFDPLRKKELPHFPFHIGIISSESGAVVHDIVKTGHLRNPCVRYTLYSSSVQGREASLDMAQRIHEAEESPDRPDVLILARGGGAEEDLSPFNDRTLLDAVHECSIPLISAVGHETDTTLTDLAADRRASTPTQAAEIAIPERKVWIHLLKDSLDHLEKGKASALDERREAVKESLLSLGKQISLEKVHRLRLETLSCTLFLERSMDKYMKLRYQQVLDSLVRLADGRKDG